MVLTSLASAQESWTPGGARTQVEDVLSAIDDGLACEEASTRLDAIFDDAVARAPLTEHEAFADIAAARRLTSQMAALDPSLRRRVWPILRDAPGLARELPLVIDQRDDVAGVYRTLMQLHQAAPKAVAAHPALTSAVCVVHDAPFVTGAMSDRTLTPDAQRIFEHLTSRRGAFDIDDLPPELLVHLVDSIADPRDLAYAVDRHDGDRIVGKRYHDVMYDTRHYKQGADKRIASHDYTLANIRTHGGVCTDQAYYAATIGKAIGVPTVIVSGRADEVGHCWVGYVKRQGRTLVFDFDEGRYDDFEDVRGVIRDPQTGSSISDDDAALRAVLAATGPAERRGAIAMLDAERRVARGYDPAGDDAREAGIQLQLALLERAAALSPANDDVWRRAAQLAPDMSDRDLRQWANALFAQFGATYPTFSYEVLEPLIASVEDAREQQRLWEWAYGKYRRQHDLGCEILVAQARMWEKRGDRAKAYDGYVDAAHRYLNETGAALDALRAAEVMLRRADESDHIVSLYEEAFKRVRQPTRVAQNFIRGTNWYRVGYRYGYYLRQAGRESEAQRVFDKIGYEG